MVNSVLYNKSSDRMPVLFLGHGSPMNAIEENEFVTGWRNIGKTIPKPDAILCISAHWETKGTYVTAMDKPSTIHDFGGFPQKLYEVEYPAPGSTELALETKKLIRKTEVGLADNRGLDHGCWSVIKHLYPDGGCSCYSTEYGLLPITTVSLRPGKRALVTSRKRHFDCWKRKYGS